MHRFRSSLLAGPLLPALVLPTLLLAALLLGGCAAPLPVVGPGAPVAMRMQPGKTAIVVGVDDLPAGFNPHILADDSSTTRALATLVLPSVFRPDPSGALTLDTTVATSAEVSAQQPFTVSYRLARDASWSDNAPIAAEDFSYLWQQMRSQPGVADAAGYQLITGVRSQAGGKTVEVVFDRSYPAWRTLFADLLPAHLLKDAPGAWNGALAGSIPVSGGPFAVDAVDRVRGQITLVRNDHYWATPAVADRLVLQSAADGALVDRLHSGDIHVAMLRADAATLSRLRTLGAGVRVRTVPQPTVVALVLRSDSGPLADPRLRRAVAASLDRDALIAEGSGGGPGAALRADAQVLAPSAPGYRPTLPATGVPTHPDPAQAAQELGSAGYVRGADGVWRRDGVPLKLTVGAPDGEQPYAGLAQAVGSQLAAAGFGVDVVAPSGNALFTQDLGASPGSAPTGSAPPGSAPTSGATPPPTGAAAAAPTTSPTPAITTPSGTGGPDAPVRVDVAVVPHPVGGDPATELASSYGCPPRPAGGQDSGSAAVPAGGALAPSNLSGFCDSSMQPLLEGALSGIGTVATALAVAEPTLWSELPVIPLFQLTTVLATDGQIPGVGVGPLLTGPLTGAQTWVPASVG